MDNETGSFDSPSFYSDGFGYDYVCRYCSKTFPSGRALGGHQNAHRFEPKERTRTRHGRMPRLQGNQQPNPPRGLPSGNGYAGPSRAANVFAPGNASSVQVGYGHAFQAQASGSRVGMPMPGPGDNFYQNDPRLFGPNMPPLCDHLAEQAEHSGVGSWAGTSRGAEIHADERATLDLDLKL